VITLKPKVNQLSEVKIEGQHFSREDKLKIFRQQFLGETKASKYCKIMNEDDIYFHYNAKTYTLTAFSDTPLKVINNYLKYELDFNLMEFQVKFFRKSIKKVDVNKSIYLGTSFFKDISQSYNSNTVRNASYYGSVKHFFKAIVDNDFDKKSFLLFKNGFQVSPSSYFKTSKENGLNKIEIIDDQGIFKLQGELKFYSKFSLLYKKSNQSTVLFHTNRFYVDDYGNNTDNDKIEFGGKISEGRVADMLPMDYLPK
jgi:uncharacterized protein YnzC (UPF0291/DUF896 family)